MSPHQSYAAYLQYLHMKVFERDWHGVADCAMDLRELEARHPELKEKGKCSVPELYCQNPDCMVHRR